MVGVGSYCTAEVTQLTVDILKSPAEAVDVIFTEIAPSDWDHGGRMYSAPAEEKQ